MKFILSTAGYFYTEDVKKRLEKLGFEFEESFTGGIRQYHKVYQQNIIEIEISSLSDLLKFYEKWGDLIISKGKEEWAITIYDYYIE